MKSFVLSTFAFLIFLSFSGCQSIETRGQFIDNSLLADLESRRLNKSQVENLLGSPTMIPDYSPNHWYYVERIMSQRAWMRPTVVQQRIVKIVFNNASTVEEVVVINDSHDESVHTVQQYTKTHGTELSGIQKFVKNFGRFNQTTGSKKKKSK